MDTIQRKRVHALVSGRVQGVGFRYFVRQAAGSAKLSGWVRNLADGRVEFAAEGVQAELEALLERVHQGPSGSRVEQLETSWGEIRDGFTDFRVRSTAAGPES